jgi:hypothetical protein
MYGTNLASPVEWRVIGVSQREWRTGAGGAVINGWPDASKGSRAMGEAWNLGSRRLIRETAPKSETDQAAADQQEHSRLRR